MRKSRRKKIFVHFPIQYKLAFLSAFGVMIPCAISFTAILTIIKALIKQTETKDAILHSSLLYLQDKVFIVLGCGFVFISLLYILWTMLFMHRIVGPLKRMESTIQRHLDGNDVEELKFRQNDYFASLGEKINKLIRR